MESPKGALSAKSRDLLKGNISQIYAQDERKPSNIVGAAEQQSSICWFLKGLI